MSESGMNGSLYRIPIYGVYGRDDLWKEEKNRSEYFDLQKDMQVALDLGNIDKLEQEYLEEFCHTTPLS